jgi:putative phosphoribosyl transferase
VIDMQFRDRSDAGTHLAARVAELSLTDPIVLAIPRGGVPVAYPVARRLQAPLDVVVARKIGAPGQPELGIGAIAEGGDPVLTAHLVEALRLTDERLMELRRVEERELARRVERYRGERRLPDLQDRDVVLVDDGLATGVTAEAAIRALRARSPRRLVLGVPACSPDTAHRLAPLAEIVCVIAPPDFGAVGLWYEDFDQTSDETVLDLLEQARARPSPDGQR